MTPLHDHESHFKHSSSQLTERYLCVGSNIVFWAHGHRFSCHNEPCLQRDGGCWLFGVPGRCGTWSLLISLFCLFAALDMIITVTTSLHGRESLDSSKEKKRCSPLAPLVATPSCFFIAAIVHAHSACCFRIHHALFRSSSGAESSGCFKVLCLA